MMTATNSMSNDINKLSNRDLISAKHTIDKEISAIRVLESELDESLTKALDMMQNAKGRVILTGMHLWLQQEPRHFLYIPQKQVMAIWE